MKKLKQTKIMHIDMDAFFASIEQRDKLANKKSPLGNGLLSQRVAPQVPSALAGLTAGFGMGPGVPPPLESPTRLFSILKYQITNVKSPPRFEFVI